MPIQSLNYAAITSRSRPGGGGGIAPLRLCRIALPSHHFLQHPDGRKTVVPHPFWRDDWPGTFAEDPEGCGIIDRRFWTTVVNDRLIMGDPALRRNYAI
jgi:hypothetical protein